MSKLSFTAACLLFLFIGCHMVDGAPPKTALKPNTLGTGIVLVYDLSRSDTCLKPDKATIARLLMQHAYAGVCLTGIHILPDSRHQQPWLSPVVWADTLPLPANFILSAKQSKRNLEAIRIAQIACDSVAELVKNRIILAQTYYQSDVAGALRLAAMSAQGYADKGIRPIVIVVSDMIQDIQEGKLPECIPALSFPPETEVIVIGAEASIPLKIIFGNVKIRELPSFQHLAI